MHGRRLLAHGPAATPCRSQWLSTSADLVASTTAVEFGSVAFVPAYHGSPRLLSRWSCSAAAFWRLFSPYCCLKGTYLVEPWANKPVGFYARTASCRGGGGFVRRSLCASLRPTSAAALLNNASPSLCLQQNILIAARALHSTPLHLTGALTHDAAAAQRTDAAEASDRLSYDPERHVESAEAVLREVYGPQAKLVLHRLTQHQGQAAQEAKDAEVGQHEGAIDAAAASAVVRVATPTRGVYYRASATFRFLGFAVELAVAKGPRAKETIESCLQQALASDITFIRPGGHDFNNRSIRGGGGGGAEDAAAVSRDRRHQTNAKRKHKHHNHNASTTGFTQRNAHAMSPSHASRLTPHQLELKAIVDDLRQLCAHFSRGVKFSVKPPFARRQRRAATETTSAARGGEEGCETEMGNEEGRREDAIIEDKQWRCRCYVKDEWSTLAQARLVFEMAGSSPNDALVRCITQLRQQYKEELESPAVLEEGIREVKGMVQSQHKTVTTTCIAEPTSPSLFSSAVPTSAASPALSSLTELPTYRAHVDVTDARGNTTSYTARQKASPYVAYEAAASLALRAETLWDSETHLLSAGLPTPPLLWRLRWQFDLLLDHICRETGQAPEEVAWIQLTGDTSQHASEHQHNDRVETDGGGSGAVDPAVSDSLGPSPSGVISGVVVPPVPPRFIGSLYSERNVLVWQTSGGGRYRVEFDTYVQALYHLLDQYADCLSTLPCMGRGVGECLLFPSARVLDLHVLRHDAFPVLQHHRGNVNCYALLGTLTSQLLGCPYITHYHFDTVTSEYVATLTVNDGRVTNQPLIQRRSKRKGESWRFACLDAIKENFPRQYTAILDRYPELDLSADDMARSAHLRALPREKRIPYFVNLSVMMLAFAEEDLGWRQPRVRLRNLANSLGLPQWTAELEAQVEGEEGRRVVAVSASFPQMQAARRSLIYRLGKQYFPNELATYKSLKRSDIIDPETEDGPRVNKFYTPNATINSSMVSHVLALIDGRHPASAPVRFTLEARVKGAAEETSVEGGGLTTAASALADPHGLLDMRYVEGDTLLLNTQDPVSILRSPRIAYTARVLGNRGDVLIADFDSDSATTAADAQAVPVLVTALKSASFHLAGGDAETLWTEYETHPLPAVTSSRVLPVALFDRFFGSAALGEATAPTLRAIPPTTRGSPATAAAAPSRGSSAAATTAVGGVDDLILSTVDASITVVTTQVGEYWFGTAVLPRLGMLPIARAVASNKRKCISDALIAAARHNFPRVLQYAIKHDVAAAAIAADILTENIVEQLPPSICQDLLAQLARRKSTRPLPPFQLLVRCTRETYPSRERFIRVQQTYDTTHGFQYRLYLQRGRVVRPGDMQLVGYGVSTTSASAALHRASVMALENLYESPLYAAVAAQPSYREPPSENN
ncbi:putative mitochondrial hypothetical protein [Leptomonas pyrrhocoris]|uniref:Uncharacterized protein n=1 Tax=Leptomonas pyrrhocoris TaxID=157538 RepID=A0A0M9G1M6_LEPPY|nr:putative mitochondrial hypothetical protein [Leptomonas pyrrhocoris]KPA80515.1 putative mitochondrial hypothetical protein [Leptomonas pyrrhocoris]|eukprot:XP_015658954.1 putative mitochondrial hypothetical protein [Leptomonas pyrrhocoris]